jgi:acetyl/propionyl-CoA carboxylase alpha subunit
LESLDQARKLALEMGFPVILKATAGGGAKVGLDQSLYEQPFYQVISIF